VWQAVAGVMLLAKNCHTAARKAPAVMRAASEARHATPHFKEMPIAHRSRRREDARKMTASALARYAGEHARRNADEAIQQSAMRAARRCRHAAPSARRAAHTARRTNGKKMRQTGVDFFTTRCLRGR